MIPARAGMVRVAELIVPAGDLRVEDTWQEITDAAQGLIGWALTRRAAWLNGEMVIWSAATRDLLDAAAWAIDDGPARTLDWLPAAALLAADPLLTAARLAGPDAGTTGTTTTNRCSRTANRFNNPQVRRPEVFAILGIILAVIAAFLKATDSTHTDAIAWLLIVAVILACVEAILLWHRNGRSYRRAA
jgi:hypothetical protein